MLDFVVTIAAVSVVLALVTLMLGDMVDFFDEDQYTRQLFRRFFRL